MGKKFFDPSSFSEPQDGVSLLSNAIRNSFEFDALGGPEFIAKVISPPQKLTSAQAAALSVGGPGAPGPTSLWSEGWEFLKSFFSDDDNEARDAERARVRNSQIEAKFTYKGRIEEIHGAFLPDPSCDLDMQGNAISDPYLLSLHTSFIAAGNEFPNIGDLVRVRLNMGANGYDLEHGIHVELFESLQALQSPMPNPACAVLSDLFETDDEIEDLTLEDYEDIEGVETTSPADSRDLSSLEPNFKEMIETLISALEVRGFQTTVFTAFRSIDTQQEKYDKGLSQVRYSYHNFVNEGGTPASQAVDLALTGVGWGDSDATSESHKQATAYFKALGEEANKLGLEWGGDWSHSSTLWAAEGIGWDPAHVELKTAPGQTLAQAEVTATEVGYSVT